MSLGKFIGQAAVSAIKEWNPFGPEAYARRDGNKAYRKARRKKRRGDVLTQEEEQALMADKIVLTTPTGETIEHTPPTIPARTSTKLAVGNGVVAAFPAVELLGWIQSLELQPAWLDAATDSSYFIYYGSLLVSYIIARISKSPLTKQAI